MRCRLSRDHGPVLPAAWIPAAPETVAVWRDAYSPKFSFRQESSFWTGVLGFWGWKDQGKIKCVLPANINSVAAACPVWRWTLWVASSPAMGTCSTLASGGWKGFTAHPPLIPASSVAGWPAHQQMKRTCCTAATPLKVTQIWLRFWKRLGTLQTDSETRMKRKPFAMNGNLQLL